MEFKHSPAPWDNVNSNDLSKPHGIISANGTPVCATFVKTVGREQADANSYLIAAAPELLEALIELTESAKEAIDGLGDLADAIDTAKAAIAKALGQQ